MSLGTLYSHLAAKIYEERWKGIVGGASYVILVLGYSATISNEDFNRAVEIIHNFNVNNPGKLSSFTIIMSVPPNIYSVYFCVCV